MMQAHTSGRLVRKQAVNMDYEVYIVGSNCPTCLAILKSYTCAATGRDTVYIRFSINPNVSGSYSQRSHTENRVNAYIPL